MQPDGDRPARPDGQPRQAPAVDARGRRGRSAAICVACWIAGSRGPPCLAWVDRFAAIASWRVDRHWSATAAAGADGIGYRRGHEHPQGRIPVLTLAMRNE